MYEFIKARGYAIYPGKVTEADTFRIGNIGEIYREDILKLIDIYREFLKMKKSLRNTTNVLQNIISLQQNTNNSIQSMQSIVEKRWTS